MAVHGMSEAATQNRTEQRKRAIDGKHVLAICSAYCVLSFALALAPHTKCMYSNCYSGPFFWFPIPSLFVPSFHLLATDKCMEKWKMQRVAYCESICLHTWLALACFYVLLFAPSYSSTVPHPTTLSWTFFCTHNRMGHTDTTLSDPKSLGKICKS